MIYKDYFIHSGFEAVWTVLQSYYDEPESARQPYKTLFYTIRNLQVDEDHWGSPLRIEFDFDNMIHVVGAPDPIEWLTGHDVVFDEEKEYELSKLLCAKAYKILWKFLNNFLDHNLTYWWN